MPKSTRYYQRKKRENNARKMSNNTIPDMNSQSLTVNFPIDRINDKRNEVIDDYESLLYNNEFNENEEPQEQYQEIEKEFLEIIEENFDSKLDKPNKVEISCALLAIFFSGRMTQHALSLVMKLVKILVKDDELPKSFDELVKTILTNNNDAIEYSKKMYCFICKKFFDVDKEKINHLSQEERKEIRLKRTCDSCSER